LNPVNESTVPEDHQQTRVVEAKKPGPERQQPENGGSIKHGEM